MKDLEILENIDLNRILNELKSRDKKINYLEGENTSFKNEINHTVNY
jgi:cell shape-determining protein MreC